MPDGAPARRVTIPCPFCSTLNRVAVARIADRPRCGQCGRPVLLDRPVRVTDETFERVARGSDLPLLVDFHADWCGPCKVIAPHVEELAGRYMGRAVVLKLDTDRNPATAGRFRIGGIPTLIVLREGTEVAREVGAVPAQRLEALLQKGLTGDGA